MMNDDELQEPMPCVIKDSLLQIGIREGLTDLERERLEDAKKNGTEGHSTLSLSPPDIKVLRLCFMHIRKIDNLQCYTGLTELYLANNCITKIENLTCLPQLVKLDLSFNQITDVDENGQRFNPYEGLETLVNLEELSLFKNKLTRLENFPILPKLRYLSLGRNKIAELTEIQNLYKLKSLRVLTIVGNPILEKDIYKMTVLAYLENLHFLDYVRVAVAEVKDARERHSDQLNQLLQSEEVEKASKDNERAQDARAKTLREAFLNKICDLHTSIFKKDNDHEKLRSIPDLAEPLLNFNDGLAKAERSFVDEIIAQAHALNNEEQLFNEAYAKVTEDTRLQMVKIIKALEKERKKFIDKVTSEEEAVNENQQEGESAYEQESQEFLEKIQNTEDELLTTEFALVDMVAEMIRTYETELDERINTICEKIAQFFGVVRNINNEYNEKVNEICLKLWERFNQGEAVEVSEEIRSILVDKDAMTSTIQTSHEHRNTKIYKREENITNAYKQRVDQMVATARQNDLERNRKRITEIGNYISNTIDVINSLGDDENDAE